MAICNVIPPPEEIIKIFLNKYYTSETSLSLIYTYEMPVTGLLTMTVFPQFANSQATGSAISIENSLNDYYLLAKSTIRANGTATSSIAGVRLAVGTKLYIFVSHNSVANNRAFISGFVIPE